MTSDLSAGKLCLPPEIPEGMTFSPNKEQYKVGELIILNCDDSTLSPKPRAVFKCSPTFTWEPPIPADLRCSNGTDRSTVTAVINIKHKYQKKKQNKQTKKTFSIQSTQTQKVTDLCSCIGRRAVRPRWSVWSGTEDAGL